MFSPVLSVDFQEALIQVRVDKHLKHFAMGFLKGVGAVRRTLQYLSKGNIILRDPVKALILQYNPPSDFPHHTGLQ
jgi:hypothetical protein